MGHTSPHALRWLSGLLRGRGPDRQTPDFLFQRKVGKLSEVSLEAFQAEMGGVNAGTFDIVRGDTGAVDATVHYAADPLPRPLPPSLPLVTILSTVHKDATSPSSPAPSSRHLPFREHSTGRGAETRAEA